MNVTELIDAAARAAVEQDSEPPVLAHVLNSFGTRRRPDGLYGVTPEMVSFYFPAEEDAEAIERAHHGVVVNGENVKMDPEIFPHAERPASAFRQFNYGILTNYHGEKPVAAREKINAAVERGDIN